MENNLLSDYLDKVEQAIALLLFRLVVMYVHNIMRHALKHLTHTGRLYACVGH